MAKNKSNKKVDQKALISQVPHRSQNLVFSFIIALLCVFLYFNTSYNDFNMDDHYVTATNDLTSQGFSAIPEIFGTVYATDGESEFGYRPLVRASFTIDYELWGGRPDYSHIFNVLLYMLAALILFSTLRRLFRDYNPYFPFIIVLLFLAHPSHTEVVASLKNRDEILSLIFALLAMKLFIRWADYNKIINLFFGLILFLLALLSKNTALSFLFLYPLTLYFFTNLSPKKLIGLSIGSLAIIILALVGPMFYLPDMARYYSFFENPLFEEKNFFTRIASGMYILLIYVKKLFLPYPLLYYYGYNTIPVKTLANAWVWVSILFYSGIFGYAVYTIKKKSALSFGILFYLLTIAMFSNLVKPMPGIIADRFLFLPSIGFSIILAWFIFKLAKTKPENLFAKKTRRVTALLITFAILIPFSVYTFNRNKNWRTYYTLYKHDIQHLDNSVKANSMLATELVRQLNLIFNNPDPSKIPPPINSQKRPIDEAVKHYKRAIEIYPEHYQSWNNIGTIQYKILKRPKLAIHFYEKCIDINPDFPNPYVNLAEIYFELKKMDTAINFYHLAFTKDSSNLTPLSKIANIFYSKGNKDKALEVNQKIIEIDSSSFLPYMNMGYYAALESDSTTAEHFLEQAVAHGYSGNIYSMLTQMYLKMGNRQEAYFMDLKAKEFNKKNK
jgi:protein O-mannosyl-transferase